MSTKLGTALAQRVADLETGHPGGGIEVQIFLRREPVTAWVAQDDGAEAPDRAEVARQAHEAAQRSQERFLAEVAPLPFRELWRHWINNSIGAEVSRDVLRTILDRPDVEHVELVSRANLKDLLHDRTEPIPPPIPPPLLAVPEVAEQVRLVRAPLLWNRGLRGRGVLVAVIDTGIDFDHPDLSRRRWNSPGFPHHGFDFVVPDGDPRDEHGHGTRCAGLIAGDGSSGTLATGIAPEATLMALRIAAAEDEDAAEAQAWSAFQFAVDHGADVISMSLGWNAETRPNYIGWRRACELLFKAGVVFVCSAGNDGNNANQLEVPRNIAAPAVCPPPWLHPLQRPGGRSSAIACGETTLTDRRINASSRGPAAWETAPFTDYPLRNGGRGLLKPDLCGPGRGAMTCNPELGVPGGPLHVPFAGTSAAAAIVAGCAALLVQAARDAKRPVLAARVQQALEEGAVRIQEQTDRKQNHFGAGRVDVAAAHEFGLGEGWW